jgi:hypothetical protein
MERERAEPLEGRVARLILLVVVSACVVFCVLCSNQRPDDCTFFSGRNFFQFCNNWCSYFDMTDSYLRFISTVSQTIVPFFPVVIFSGCNLNLPKNIAGQTTVPFFSVGFFLVVSTIPNWCSCQNTNANYDPKKLRPEKKGTVVWPVMFFEPPKKNHDRKKGTVV